MVRLTAADQVISSGNLEARAKAAPKLEQSAFIDHT
jgi:hypothetical protein